MNDISKIDPLSVKLRSESIILELGGKVCDWLPYIEQTKPRSLEEIANRALVLNAMINLGFGAPPQFIREWIIQNKLVTALADSEKFIVDDADRKLSNDDYTNFKWLTEALWTLMWACGKVEHLEMNVGVQNTLASMLPNLQRNEPAHGFVEKLMRREYPALYEMRDLIYRVNWYAKDGHMKGYATHPIHLAVIMQRRRAIEWVCDSEQDWDDTDKST